MERRGEAMVLVPVLMLPALIGALALLVVPDGAWRADARALIVLGLVASAWYLLGGALALRRLADSLRLRRRLRALTGRLADEGEPLWASDAAGNVVWQNDAALRLAGDIGGAGIDRALRRLVADAAGVAEVMLGRAGPFGAAERPLLDGRLRLVVETRDGIALWRLRDPAPPQGHEPELPRPAASARICDRLPVALLQMGERGRVSEANPAAIELLGPVPPGAGLADLLDGLGRPVDEWVEDVRTGRTEARPEVLHCRAANPERYVQVTLGRDGDMVHAVLSDASAIKTLEAQFVQSQKMQAIGQLAGGIAHDFNNLLTAISGHVDLLMLRRDKADPDYADLDQIAQNANRAAALVSQLLAFSRKQTLKPRLFDLRDTIADLTHLLGRLVGERVRLEVEHDPDLSPIRADRRQVEQVIMNLVVNARDAMPEGGEVTIRTRNVTIGTAQRRDKVALPKGRWVCVTVSDDGQGIPPDRLDKIFEPFFTTKRTGEGTGLGLSTVYGIIKQTGGYIFCDSTLGQGTVFTVYFPAHDRAVLAAAQRAEAEESAARAAAERARIAAGPEVGPAAVVLLVEDEAPVRAFAARALRLKGFEVLEADSAESALRLLAATPQRIDVFVTDVVMPGMDGPSWVRTALRDHPQTRVLFMSGYSEDIFAEGREPVPGAVFLQKPFSLADLTETVRRLHEHAPAAAPAVPIG